jgi:hypothetical protein
MIKKTFVMLPGAPAMRIFILAAGALAILSTKLSFQQRHVSLYDDVLAMERLMQFQAPQSPSEVAYSASVVLSGQNYTYYYPRSLKTKPLFMLTGILSAMKNKVERNLIRNTWGSLMEPKSILFLVASEDPADDWTREMAVYQDLLVVNATEIYDGTATILPQKVQTFFHAASTVLPESRFIFKTDDDTFVHPHRLKTSLMKIRPEYWGWKWKRSPVIRNSTHKWYVSEEIYPHAQYPDYCAGAGYVMSRNFLKCAVTHLADTPFMPMEDVGTGILAQKCHVIAKHSTGVYDNDWNYDYSRMILKHRLKNHTTMLQFWEKLRKAPYQDRIRVASAPQSTQKYSFINASLQEMQRKNHSEELWWMNKCKDLSGKFQRTCVQRRKSGVKSKT